MDDEILQDFIVEAGEIIENLNEQLVQIEKTPDDKDLLNAIFRGFHTVKGGAGFLQLSSLVEVCHAAESLFDELRNGRISMSPDLMDAVLQAYDEITTMFDAVKNGDTPEDAPADLIDRLHALAAGKSVAAPAAAPIETSIRIIYNCTSVLSPVFGEDFVVLSVVLVTFVALAVFAEDASVSFLFTVESFASTVSSFFISVSAFASLKYLLHLSQNQYVLFPSSVAVASFFSTFFRLWPVALIAVGLLISTVPASSEKSFLQVWHLQ